jgi:hypothetical protein
MKQLFLLCILTAAGCSAASSAGGDSARTATKQTAAQTSCSMSFRELFHLAKGRDWTQEELQSFKKLDQPAKNAMVKQLAAEAGCIKTEDQVGTDGVIYTAFWKE